MEKTRWRTPPRNRKLNWKKKVAKWTSILITKSSSYSQVTWLELFWKRAAKCTQKGWWKWFSILETLCKDWALINTTKILGFKQLNSLSYAPIQASCDTLGNEWRYKTNRSLKKNGDRWTFTKLRPSKFKTFWGTCWSVPTIYYPWKIINPNLIQYETQAWMSWSAGVPCYLTWGVCLSSC